MIDKVLLKGLSHIEAAADLELPEGTLKSRLLAAKCEHGRRGARAGPPAAFGDVCVASGGAIDRAGAVGRDSAPVSRNKPGGAEGAACQSIFADLLSGIFDARLTGHAASLVGLRR